MKNIPWLSGTRNTTVTEATPHCFTHQIRSKVKQTIVADQRPYNEMQKTLFMFISWRKRWLKIEQWNMKQQMWLRGSLFFLSCASIRNTYGFWLGSNSLAQYISFFTTVKTIRLLWLLSDITGTFSTTYSVGNVCNLRCDNHMARKVFANKCVCYTTAVCAVGSLPCWGGAQKTCRSRGLTEEERIL